MKRWAAGLVTAGLLALALWAGRAGSPSTANSVAATPDGCIQQMFAAAAAGDVATYLNCFSGEERAQMERKFSGQNRETASASLRAVVAGMKGHAVHGSGMPSRPADRLPDMIELPVERIYAQHNELQTYRLRRSGNRWQIEAVRATGSQQPSIPYGTPVF